MTTPSAPATVAPTETNFFTALLQALHDPVTQANLAALEAVAQLEGQNSYYNPLNSTILAPGSKTLPGNSAGVQMYSSFDSGVAATADLLKGSRWTNVQAALANGGSTQADLNAFQSTYASWGSHVTFPSTPNAGSGNKSVGPNPGTGVIPVIGGSDASVGGPTTTSLDPFGVVSDASSIAGVVEQAWGDFTKASFWLRLGLVLFGFLFVLIAIDKLTSGAVADSGKAMAGGITGGETDNPEGGSNIGDSDPSPAPAPVPDTTESGRHQAGSRKSAGPLGKHRSTSLDSSGGGMASNAADAAVVA